uniref:HDC02265 n=1 Tax=Drosophila melanogaster TaxID=7227 RepID=Q6IHL2_DROME|nr:TPA_inf: HDC02265 [Drosophila melanogaster]
MAAVTPFFGLAHFIHLHSISLVSQFLSKSNRYFLLLALHGLDELRNPESFVPFIVRLWRFLGARELQQATGILSAPVKHWVSRHPGPECPDLCPALCTALCPALCPAFRPALADFDWVFVSSTYLLSTRDVSVSSAPECPGSSKDFKEPGLKDKRTVMLAFN